MVFERSEDAFGFGLFEGTGILGPSHFQPIYLYSEDPEEDETLRFFESCELYNETVGNNDTASWEAELYFKNNIGPVVQDVIQTLGINTANTANWVPSDSDVLTMFKACLYDIGILNTTEKFCKLFTEQHAEMFEYYDDLETYWLNGPGTPLASEISCTLLNDFFSSFDAVIDGSSQELANLRFAHAETIMPFLTLLELYIDPVPLHYNSAPSVIANRKWRSSIISPYSANFVMVLSNCSGELHVTTLHNEMEAKLPPCSGDCLYKDLRHYYSKWLGNQNCNFEKMCAVSPSSTTSFVSTGDSSTSSAAKSTGGPSTPSPPDENSISSVLAGIISAGSFVVGGLLCFVIVKVYYSKQLKEVNAHSGYSLVEGL